MAKDLMVRRGWHEKRSYKFNSFEVMLEIEQQLEEGDDAKQVSDALLDRVRDVVQAEADEGHRELVEWLDACAASGEEAK